MFRRLSQYWRGWDRRIFRFYDGRRSRWIDPIEAWCRLEIDLGEEWSSLLRVIATPAPALPSGVSATSLESDFQQAREAAAVKLADAVCRAFDVEKLSDAGGKPQGLTRAERIALAAEFLDYMGGLAAQARPFAISPRSASACPAASITASGQDCGSVGKRS